MRIPRIYHPGEYSPGDIINLNSDAFQHVIKALRLPVTAQLILFDGLGKVFSAEITEATKKSCQVKINSQEISPPPTLKLTLAQAIIKTDKMDLILQKAVELGATNIFPLISERCDIKLKPEILQKKQAHWEKIIVSACEQSGVNYLPNLYPIYKISDWLTQHQTELGLVLNPYTDKTFSTLKHETSDVSLIIGPEGGFTEAEVQLAENQGFESVKLGQRILRAETAAIAGITLCQWQFGDF